MTSTTTIEHLPASSAGRAEVLRKHVDVVHSSARMTLKERHCANVLLLNAMRHGFESLQSKRQHTIPLGDLCESVFSDRQNRIKIRNTLKGLLHKTVEWAYTTERSKRSVGESTWLAGYKIEDGLLYYSYSAEIVDELLQPRIYARLNHSIQHLIRRSHSQSLYENCARYRDLGRTKVWTLEIFRGLMGIQDCKTYAAFKALNRSVIKPAVKEVNQKTEIFVEPIFYKTGGQVASIAFNIRQNEDYEGPSIPGVIPLSNHFDSEMLEERAETYEKLLAFGLSHSRTVDLLELHEDAYILDNLKVVAQRVYDGESRIRNVPGYVVKALKNDYRETITGDEFQAALNLESDDERKCREQQRRATAATQNISEFEATDLSRWRAEQWEATLNPTEYEAERELFHDAMIAENAFLRKMINDNPDSAWLRGLWRQWIRDNKLGDPTEQERQACAAAISVDLDGLRLVAKSANAV